MATGALPGFLAAALAPRIRDDFAFSSSSLGLAAACFYLVSMVFSTPLGPAGRADRGGGGHARVRGTDRALCVAVAGAAPTAPPA